MLYLQVVSCFSINVIIHLDCRLQSLKNQLYPFNQFVSTKRRDKSLGLTERNVSFLYLFLTEPVSAPADRLDLSYSKRKKKAKKSSKENKRRPSDQQASTPIHTPLAGSSRLNQQPTQLSTTGYYGSPSLFQEAPAKKDRDHQVNIYCMNNL